MITYNKNEEAVKRYERYERRDSYYDEMWESYTHDVWDSSSKNKKEDTECTFPFYFKVIQAYILITERITGKTLHEARHKHALRIMDYIKKHPMFK